MELFSYLLDYISKKTIENSIHKNMTSDRLYHYLIRAVGRSENPGVPIVIRWA